MSTKKCTNLSCKNPMRDESGFLLSSEFYLRSSGVLRGDCKHCVVSRSAKRYLLKKEEIIEKSRPYRKAYKLANKERLKQKNKEWVIRNSEHVKQTSKAWQKNNVEKNRAYQAEYKQDHEKWSKRLKSGKDWAARNPDKVRAKASKRRATKLNALPPWSTLEMKTTVEQFYTVARLQSQLTGIPHQVDHRIPLVNSLVCGLHIPENLQILTAKENASKNNKFIPTVENFSGVNVIDGKFVVKEKEGAL